MHVGNEVGERQEGGTLEGRLPAVLERGWKLAWLRYYADMAEDVTRLLQAAREGDARAADLLMPLVYEQLRTLAKSYMRSERPDHTLRPTAVVHDAYLKLAHSGTAYTDRLHFYAVAARAMRQILTDWARTSHRGKRGGGAVRVDLEEHHAIDSAAPEAMLEVDRLLTRLRAFDERKADVVELIFFGGMTYDEVAALLGLSAVSVHRDLKMAKAWMRAEMMSGQDSGTDS